MRTGVLSHVQPQSAIYVHTGVSIAAKTFKKEFYKR